jgi:hypothetical protein
VIHIILSGRFLRLSSLLLPASASPAPPLARSSSISRPPSMRWRSPTMPQNYFRSRRRPRGAHRRGTSRLAALILAKAGEETDHGNGAGSLASLAFLDFNRLRIGEIREIVRAAAALGAANAVGLQATPPGIDFLAGISAGFSSLAAESQRKSGARARMLPALSRRGR